MTELTEALEYLLSSKTALISVHVNPDGDAVGAAYAMAACLEMNGIKPLILFEGYNGKYDFLEGTEFVYTGGDYDSIRGDIFISLDSASKERLGEKAQSVFERCPRSINIDHHISNTYFAHRNIVMAEYSSTCEVIYDIIKQKGLIDGDIASALYAGIIYDTGGLMHNCTTANTLNVVSRLIALNIPFSEIYKNTLCVHSFAEAKVFGRALQNFGLSDCGRVAYSFVTFGELSEFDADKNDTDNIANYLLNTRGAEVSALFVERAAYEIKASFRSLCLDVNKLAGMFDGGGHMNAAGATIKGKLKDIMAKVLAEIQARLQ